VAEDLFDLDDHGQQGAVFLLHRAVEQRVVADQAGPGR
jgi:hypothetical protein